LRANRHDYSIVNIMLFNKRNQKAFRAVWIIIAVLIMVSMVMLYMPALLG
jgi:predicted nucleic acid-binding Zn ribbon protein